MRSAVPWAILVLFLNPSGGAMAAQTYSIPVTVVPGSVEFRPSGSSSALPSVFSPVTLPVSEQVAGNSSCSEGLVTVDADVVDGGLEMGIGGATTGAGPATCSLGGELELDVEVQVPELGGTATSVRLTPSVVNFDFASHRRVSIGIAPVSSSGTTSSLPGLPFEEPSTSWELIWADGSGPTLSPPMRHFQWVPGDTLRFRVRVSASMFGNNGISTVGNVRTRWTYRVTVPEPSAGLSIPLGVLTLTWLASPRPSPVDIAESRGPQLSPESP
jgi:hypothetical protein